MKTIFNIANITFWEVIRDKILYGLIFMAVILLLVSAAMAQLSFAEEAKITIDFSLFVLNISTVIISIFLGAQLLYREIENKTLLTLLTHPVSRIQFLLGKILGLFFIILLLAAIFTCILISQAIYYEFSDLTLIITPMLGILLESLIILSLTICLSSIFKVSVTVIFALFIYLIGHSVENMKFFADKTEGQLLDVIYNISNTVLPNLELMNWKSIVTTQTQVEASHLFMVVAYSFMWFAIYSFTSLILFSRKDIS